MSDQEMQERVDALYFAYRALAEALETHGVLDSQRLQARLRIGAMGMYEHGGMPQAVHDNLIALADQLLLDSFHRRGLSPEDARRRLSNTEQNEKPEAQPG